MVNLDKLTQTHIAVLKEILRGKSFEDIEEQFSSEFEELNYKKNIIEKANRLTFDDDGKLIGAYPVCPIPTAHKVKVEGVGEGYAMCAIDALGMAYTFKKKTTITSKLQKSGEEFTLTIDPDSETLPDTDVVVTYNKLGYDNLQELVTANSQLAVDACPNINFYATKDQVPDSEGIAVLDLPTALEESKKIFTEEGIKQHLQRSIQQ